MLKYLQFSNANRWFINFSLRIVGNDLSNLCCDIHRSKDLFRVVLFEAILLSHLKYVGQPIVDEHGHEFHNFGRH